MYFKKVRLFLYLAAFFTILCGYAWPSDYLLRLPSIAKYSPNRLDEAVKQANVAPINPFLLFEAGRDKGNITIDENTIVLIGGGGDCAGLNYINAETVTGLIKAGFRVVGVKNGFDGMLADDWEKNIVELTLELAERMKNLPSTVLGSARVNLDKEENEGRDPYGKIKSRFGKAASIIGWGGNDHTEELKKISDRCQIPTLCAPKSIDNDFKTAMLGFISAVMSNRIIVKRASMDPASPEAENTVAVFEGMGRKAGYLTLESSKACPYPHVVLLPEKSLKVTIQQVIGAANAGIRNFFVSEGFSFDEKDPDLKRLLDANHGLKLRYEKALKNPERDKKGNPKLTGASLFIVGILEDLCHLKVQRTDLTYQSRGASVSPFDIFLAKEFGDAAVKITVEDKVKLFSEKRTGFTLTYPGYNIVKEGTVVAKPAEEVYPSRDLDSDGTSKEELAKWGVLGTGLPLPSKIASVESPQEPYASIEEGIRANFYAVNISTRAHASVSCVEIRAPSEAIVSACGRQQDLTKISNEHGLRDAVEATEESVLVLIPEQDVSFEEIAAKIKEVYDKFGYVNVAISNDFPLNRRDNKLLRKILAKDPILKAKFDKEDINIENSSFRFESGISNFIIGLFNLLKSEGIIKKKSSTRVTGLGYAFKGLPNKTSKGILQDRGFLERQGVVMTKPVATQLAASEDKKRRDAAFAVISPNVHPWHRKIITPTGTIFAPRDANRPIDEEEARKLVQDARHHGGQVRLMVEDDDMMTYVAGDVLANLMDSAQFTFNIGLATGGTTESLRKMLGLSDMLYNIYGKTLDPDKIQRICTLDNYYFTNYLRERGVTEEEAEKILAISSYESEQLYMMIENLMGGKENVKPGFFIAPHGRSSLDWFGEAARFRRLMLKYFVVQLWQLHGIGSNSHDAFNEIYRRVQRDLSLAGMELYKNRQVKKAVLRDNTDLAKYGMDKVPPFAKIPLEFSSMGNMRPDSTSLISFIIQVQNAGHFIPRSFHPFFLKFMADNSLYDVDELIAGILSMDQEQLCNYTSNPKYHFRDIQHFVDELNFLFKHYSDVPLESITQGTEDILTRSSRQLQDGSYPLQVFMASQAHKQLGVLRALTDPNWSTAYHVLNRAKAVLLIATKESLAKVSDRDTMNTFFTVEPENPNVRGLSWDSVEKNWRLTLPGIRIKGLMTSM